MATRLRGHSAARVPVLRLVRCCETHKPKSDSSNRLAILYFGERHKSFEKLRIILFQRTLTVLAPSQRQPTPKMKTDSDAGEVVQPRLVRPSFWMADRGYAEPFDCYRSRFGFLWWFWMPRIHTQTPDSMNPRVIRLIWLCFAFNVDIWTDESREFWPNSQLSCEAERSHD